jgi:hypothetical protein
LDLNGVIRVLMLFLLECRLYLELFS